MPKFSKPENCQICPYKSEFLKLLPTSEIDSIQNGCLIINFKRGETISKQGSKATHVLYLAKGCVKVSHEGKSKNTIFSVINKKGYIGLHSIFTDQIHRFNIQAVEDAKICMIEANLFVSIAKANPDFLMVLTKQISQSVNCVFDKSVTISEKHLKARLADVLLELTDNVFCSTQFAMPFTRKELGEMGGMTTENAVRTLTELKKEGIINETGRQFEILQLDLLRKISEIG